MALSPRKYLLIHLTLVSSETSGSLFFHLSKTCQTVSGSDITKAAGTLSTRMATDFGPFPDRDAAHQFAFDKTLGVASGYSCPKSNSFGWRTERLNGTSGRYPRPHSRGRSMHQSYSQDRRRDASQEIVIDNQSSLDRAKFAFPWSMSPFVELVGIRLQNRTSAETVRPFD